MGGWGAIIMGFFGGLFAAMTLSLGLGWTGLVVIVPFVVSAGIAAIAGVRIRAPGAGPRLSGHAQRVVLWSTIGEGIGLFVAANLVINLHHRALLMPAMALVVGLHFLPIARAAAFRPYLVLGAALIAAAVLGFALPAPAGGVVAGFAAAGALWIAALLAVRREHLSKVEGLSI